MYKFTNNQFTFLESPTLLDVKNIYKIRLEIFKAVVESEYFDDVEIELLSRIFQEKIGSVTYSGNTTKMNTHSIIFRDLLVSVFEKIKQEVPTNVELIFDDFTNKDVKEDVIEIVHSLKALYISNETDVKVSFLKSKNVVGLWLADLAASIPRKTLEKSLNCFTFTKGTVTLLETERELQI